MREPLKQDSKSRQAQCEEPAEKQAAAAALFRRPSRRCSERNSKIKKQPRALYGWHSEKCSRVGRAIL